MKLKKLFIFVASCHSLLLFPSSAGTKLLVVELKSDTFFKVSFERKPSLSLDNGFIRFSAKDFDTQFEFSSLSSVYFEDSLTTNLLNVNSTEYSFYVNDESIVITGVKEGEQIVVHDELGRVIGSKIADSSAVVSLPLPNFKGVFLLFIGGKSIKFVKR